MRRFFICAGILLSVLFLSACSAKENSQVNRPILNFKSDVEIISEHIQVLAKITRLDDYTQIEIVSPDSLSGLQISHSQKENAISKNGLSYKTYDPILPRDADISSVFEVLDFMESGSNEEPFFKDYSEIAFIGKIDTGKFELRANKKTGFITGITIDDKVTIKFSNQEAL